MGRAEKVLVGLGLLLLLVWGGIRLHGWLSSRNALRQFRESVEGRPPAVLPGEDGTAAGGSAAGAASPVPVPTGEPDTSLWAEGRVRKYRESLRQDTGRAIAILSIPSIDLTVPVFDGTGPVILNRGVGRIAGTARPGEPGNLGIAGHRDGFFRGLKDVAPGDTIELETAGGRFEYAIRWIRIVAPDDVSVLAPSTKRELTLVTCYPFYFVGKAPKRYIVRAELVRREAARGSSGDGPEDPARR